MAFPSPRPPPTNRKNTYIFSNVSCVMVIHNRLIISRPCPPPLAMAPSGPWPGGRAKDRRPPTLYAYAHECLVIILQILFVCFHYMYLRQRASFGTYINSSFFC